jgi:hypothetical protein
MSRYYPKPTGYVHVAVCCIRRYGEAIQALLRHYSFFNSGCEIKLSEMLLFHEISLEFNEEKSTHVYTASAFKALLRLY